MMDREVACRRAGRAGQHTVQRSATGQRVQRHGAHQHGGVSQLNHALCRGEKPALSSKNLVATTQPTAMRRWAVSASTRSGPPHVLLPPRCRRSGERGGS